MNSLDLIIALIVVAYALSGYVQGFVVNLVSTVGLLAGGLVALLFVPKILSNAQPSVGTSLMALGIVVMAAATGQIIGTGIGSSMRRGIRSDPARWLDALGGSLLSIVAVLVASWALGYSVSGSQVPYLSNAARGSAVLGTVDGLMPERADDVLRSFNRVIDSSLFPRYLDPFDREEITAVGPPDPETLTLPGVREAAGSVFKILGEAECGRGLEGSGFVYANERVMTNAHVVAGVRSPVVVTTGGQLDAQIVLFNPDLDVAVLRVPGLRADNLAFAPPASSGDDAAILGYPGNGPFDAQSARIRTEIRLRSPDIYGKGQTVRQTYSLRGLVRSGNSGGPLVSPDGTVVGVIFAASITDKSTGYALTAEQVAADAATGATATATVSSGNCA